MTPAIKSRNTAMAAMYRDGHTLQQIGDIYGITRERVRQILTGHFDLRGKDGGMHLRATQRRVKSIEQRNERFFRHKGCSWLQYVELRAMGKPTRAFSMQRKNAHRRGICWELTLWEWWQIWQKSGHWQQRGRGNGYVMCRKGDVGPYSIDNVFIARGIENSSNRVGKKSNLPIGVRKNPRSAGYSAQRHINGSHRWLGSFPTIEQAQAAYLAADPFLARAA